MKSIPKIKLLTAVFAIAVAGAVFGRQSAWAASQLTAVEYNAVLEAPANIGDFRVDQIVTKYTVSYRVNQQIQDGDYFEILTHGLPKINDRDILAGNGSNEVIGKMTSSVADAGTRGKQIINANNLAQWQALRPEDSQKIKYKFVFNEKAAALNNISFSYEVVGPTVSNAIADHKYEVTPWIEMGGNRTELAPYNVRAYSKSSAITTKSWLGGVRLHTDKNNHIITSIGYDASENLTGGRIEYEICDTKYVKFSNVQTRPKFGSGSNFIYNDQNRINAQGVIEYMANRSLTVSLASVDDNQIVYSIDRQNGDVISTGLNVIDMDLTELGEQYARDNGTTPPVIMCMRQYRADGTLAAENKGRIGMIISGSESNFISSLRPTTPTQPETSAEPAQEQPKEEPKEPAPTAPDTGVGNNSQIVAVSVAIVGVVLLAATVMFRKKIAAKVNFKA